MSLLKVVKSKHYYLHSKTNTDNMHIKVLYLKRAYNKLEQYPLNLFIYWRQDCLYKWPEMASPAFLVFKIFRGRTPDPPSRLDNMWFIFQSKHCSTQAFSNKWGFQLGSKNIKSNFYIDLWQMGYNFIG